MEEDDFTPFGDLVPENAVPTFGFMVISYLDAESGEVFDDYRVVGNVTLRDALGTVESMKFRMACDQFDVVRKDDD